MIDETQSCNEFDKAVIQKEISGELKELLKVTKRAKVNFLMFQSKSCKDYLQTTTKAQ